MNNLDIYEKVRSVPDTACRKITGGRLNGKTDINPMWRSLDRVESAGITMWIGNGRNHTGTKWQLLLISAYMFIWPANGQNLSSGQAVPCL